MKKQVVVIHGGDTFENYEEYMAFLKDFVIEDLDYFTGTNWKDTLAEDLGTDFEVIAPKMPNKINAKYVEWKIWFEKLFPFITDDVILVGHSLGGIFLAKYLSENIFPNKIKALFLISAPFDEKDADYKLADFILGSDLSKISEQVENINLYHSKDDYVVPFVDVEKYHQKLPTAEINVFENRGHFTQEKFAELVEEIKKL